MPYPAVDDALAADVLRAIGARPDDPASDVIAAFRHWLPAGSTAKWAAVDRGAVPPGADPAVALEARLAGSLESWSCWPTCTGLGGVLAALGHDVSLVVEHHRHTTIVDHHSVLLVDGDLVDPYLGPSAPVPPGHDVVGTDAWAAFVPGGPDGRADHLGLRGGGATYRYRFLGERLDRRDVDAFCQVSVTHTGVGRRRYAHWLDRDDRLWTVREGEDGTAELREAVGGSPFCQTRRIVERGPYEELRTRIDEPIEVAA